ncbi:MAG: ArsA family ATPase [Carbonactinosporaceae bacterium]
MSGPAGSSARLAAGANPVLDVDVLLDDPGTRIVVCCGAGGVGKTTAAAALGLRAAERGRHAVVLTIDPARRLAQSLGLSQLDNSPRRVEGVDTSQGGQLHAMMLDMKRTFDEVVVGHSDPERARQILANPFYQSLSSSFAGTQEYMAMEKLGQLRARDEWDLIVVDTPPSRSALDFLDAPKRLGSFLDGRLIRLLTTPARAGGRAYVRFLSAGVGAVTGTLTKILGAQVLRDVQTFVTALDTMFGGFRERADATYQLLQAEGTAFLVVAAPERDALREASYFVERLAEEHMPLAGLVFNRVHVSRAEQLSAERSHAAAEALEEADEHPLTAALLRLHAVRMQVIARERRLRERFTSVHRTVPVAEVQALPGDVHDLHGLRKVGSGLAGSDKEVSSRETDREASPGRSREASRGTRGAARGPSADATRGPRKGAGDGSPPP